MEVTLMGGIACLDVSAEQFWKKLVQAVLSWAHVEIGNTQDAFVVKSLNDASSNKQSRAGRSELHSFIRFANREENALDETLPFKGHDGGVQPFVIVRFVKPNGSGSCFLSLLELSFFGCQPPQRKALTLSLKRAIKLRGLNVSDRLYSRLLVPATGMDDLLTRGCVDEFVRESSLDSSKFNLFTEHAATSAYVTHSRQIPTPLNALFITSFEWEGGITISSSSSLFSSQLSPVDHSIAVKADLFAKRLIQSSSSDWTLAFTQGDFGVIEPSASNYSFTAQFVRMVSISSPQRAVLTHSKPLTQEYPATYVLGDQHYDQDRSRFEQRTIYINVQDSSMKWRINYLVEKNVYGHDASECITSLEHTDKQLIEGIIGSMQ